MRCADDLFYYLGNFRVRALYAVDEVAEHQTEAVRAGSHVRLDVAAFEILVRRNILDFPKKTSMQNFVHALNCKFFFYL